MLIFRSLRGSLFSCRCGGKVLIGPTQYTHSSASIDAMLASLVPFFTEASWCCWWVWDSESRSLLSKLVQITLSQVQIGPNRSKSVQIGPNRSNSLSVNLYQQHHRIFPFLVQPFPHTMQHKITVLLTHTRVSIFAFVDLLELFQQEMAFALNGIRFCAN